MLKTLGLTKAEAPKEAAASESGRRGRPTKYTDLDLARPAKAYVKACGDDPDTGLPRRNPIAFLTEAAKRKRTQWTPSQVRMMVGLARKRKLLTGADGRAGGVLSQTALRLLAQGRSADRT